MIGQKVRFFGLACLVWLFVQNIYSQQYYGKHLCNYPDFKCIKVGPNDTWKKLFPDERDRAIVKRLNRTNIPLSYRRWIVIPTNLEEVNYLDLSPFPAAIKPLKERLIIVNLSLEAFGAFDGEGQLVHWGPVSGGRDWCDDVDKPCRTALGTFRIYRTQGPECKSSKYPIEEDGGAPMPYCMHYKDGFALHGSPTLPGFHASHGCIRLFEDDAEWLNKNFIKIGTKVIVMP